MKTYAELMWNICGLEFESGYLNTKSLLKKKTDSFDFSHFERLFFREEGKKKRLKVKFNGLET